MSRIAPIVLTVIFVSAFQSPSQFPHGVTAKVADKVPLQAYPFPRTAVRLLDGPFRQAMIRDQEYLLSLDPDRLLHNFRVTAGLPSTAKPLGGWEAPDVELRGHSVGHYLSGLALMYAATGDARFKARADLTVTELGKVQDAEARKFNPGYLSAFPEEFFDRVDARRQVWAPYYTIHKIMAGLLDAYELCGNARALEMVTKQADWVKLRVDRLTEDQQQAALQTEFGGMNEVLTNIYAATSNPEYLRVAKRFDHKRIFDPLARGEDPLNGIHGNTQIPKAIGAAREYEVTGDTRYRDIASFFWQRVALHRSFVIGGNTDRESFFPPEEFSKHLGTSSAETCNTYNMLKLTRHVFAWSPSAEAMDFYERALYNHILPSQDPQTGMVLYYCPLRPGAYKSFSTPDDSFWCCVGTGMENHAKYADSIYFHTADTLYVNLFIPSELKWTDKGLTVRQDTKFPDEDSTKLTITSGSLQRLTLKIRAPFWTTGMAVAINGRHEAIEVKPGSFVEVAREWKTGDTVQVRMPMSLRTEAMPDDPNMIAVMYGPLVLAGDLGKEGLEGIKRYGPSTPQLDRIRTPIVPAFVGSVKDVVSKLKPVPGASMTFRTAGLAQPHEVTLSPFNRMFDNRYNVYWKVYAPDEWERRRTEAATVESRRKTIESRTVDLVDANDPKSEKTHNLQGENMPPEANRTFFEGRKTREAALPRGRGAQPTGTAWFSYDLKLPPSGPATLVFTVRGSEGRPRRFDVLVDGQKIASESLEIHPTETFDIERPIPESLTAGKQKVTVRFEAQPPAATGAVLEVRLISAR